jgi:hypothetical protein
MKWNFLMKLNGEHIQTFVLNTSPSELIASFSAWHQELFNSAFVKMTAVKQSETLVNFHQPAQRNIPEDSHLHTHCHEDLKSQRFIRAFPFLLSSEPTTALKSQIGLKPLLDLVAEHGSHLRQLQEGEMSRN